MTLMASTHPQPGQLVGCEFCDELRGDPSSRFRTLYSGILSRRHVSVSEGFVAMPTLGQLLRGSMLVLPQAHYETAAQLDPAARNELAGAVEEVERTLNRHGQILLFEHGSTCLAAGGCGIYHAHIHVVPVPTPLAATEVLPGSDAVAGELDECLEELAGCSHYAWCRGTSGDWSALRLEPTNGRSLPSQHLRRYLTDRFGLRHPWDWRAYAYPERAVVDAASAFVA